MNDLLDFIKLIASFITSNPQVFIDSEETVHQTKKNTGKVNGV